MSHAIARAMLACACLSLNRAVPCSPFAKKSIHVRDGSWWGHCNGKVPAHASSASLTAGRVYAKPGVRLACLYKMQRYSKAATLPPIHVGQYIFPALSGVPSDHSYRRMALKQG